MVEIAASNEFGRRDLGIPERSFLRATIDENTATIARMQKNIHRAVMMGLYTPRQGLAIIGLYVQKLIQRKITEISEPPNAPLTQERKGRGRGPVNNPLIDTGQLRASIRHVEVLGKFERELESML